MPARNGVTSALLVRLGFNGVDDIMSGRDNFLLAYWPQANPELLVEKLGERYEIAGTNLKRWTVGSPIQAPLDVATNPGMVNNAVALRVGGHESSERGLSRDQGRSRDPWSFVRSPLVCPLVPDEEQRTIGRPRPKDGRRTKDEGLRTSCYTEEEKTALAGEGLWSAGWKNPRAIRSIGANF